jgi:hypothetical protein
MVDSARLQLPRRLHGVDEVTRSNPSHYPAIHGGSAWQKRNPPPPPTATATLTLAQVPRSDQFMTKIPARFFRDFSEGGPAAVILLEALRYRTDQSWRADGFLRNLRDAKAKAASVHNDLLLRIRDALAVAPPPPPLLEPDVCRTHRI